MISLLLGTATSYGVGGIFIDSSSTKSNLGVLMLVEAFIYTLSFALIVVFFKEKVLLDPDLENNENINSDLKKILKNGNYLLLLISISVSVGTINFLSVVIETITDDLNYSSEQASVLALGSIGSGILGIIVSSIISTIIQKYKIICIVALLFSIILTSFLYYTLEDQAFYVSIIASSLLGFFATQNIPLGFELGAEISHPITPMISSGLINCLGGILTVVPVLIAYYLGNTGLGSLLVALTLFSIGLLLMCFVKEDLNRKASEENR
jgi:Na+/melibiose symporter-like transporter